MVYWVVDLSFDSLLAEPGSLTGTKRESLYGDAGQDGLFIIYIVLCNEGADFPKPNWYRD